MANPEHVAKLKEGVEAWNKWRKENAEEKPNLAGVTLKRANLPGVNPVRANLTEVNLEGANLDETNLRGANLGGARIIGTDISCTALTNTKLHGADFTGARIYGISVWDMKTDERTIQQDLVITQGGQPVVTADDLEVAQFIYSLLDNRRLRRVIDVMTSQMFLIHGNFDKERKAVLDKIKEWLRYKNYLPVLFDFPGPE